jgi:HEAT repeat protein
MADLDDLLRRLTGGDDVRAEAAAIELAGAVPAAVPSLLRLLSSSTADERWWALRTLALIEGPSPTQALIDALSDPDPLVRQCAALGLRGRKEPASIQPLVNALSDSDRSVARLAGDSLASLAPAAMPALVEAAHSQNQAIRIEAVRALALARDPSSVPVLLAALDDESTVVAFWADLGLERLGVGMAFFKP